MSLVRLNFRGFAPLAEQGGFSYKAFADRIQLVNVDRKNKNHSLKLLNDNLTSIYCPLLLFPSAL